jgi:hypothetical protein
MRTRTIFLEVSQYLFGDVGMLGFNNFCCEQTGLPPILRVPVERDHGFRWKMITQSGGS